MSFSQGATKHCIFEGCVSDTRYGPPTKFLAFPKPCLAIRRKLINLDKQHLKTCKLCERCVRWISYCAKPSDFTINNVKRHTYICQKHFVDEDGPSEMYPNPLPTSTVLKIQNSTQFKRYQKEGKYRPTEESPPENQIEFVSVDCVDEQPLPNNNLVRENVRRVNNKKIPQRDTEMISLQPSSSRPTQNFSVQKSVQTDARVREVRDIGFQVNFRESVIDLIKTESQLNTLTGLKSFSLLSKLKKAFNELDINDRFKITPFKRLLLTLMKIRRNVPYSILAIMFDMTSLGCRTVFIKTVPRLCEVLRSLLLELSVSCNDQSKKMLERFKEFPNVRLVLYSTEICFQSGQTCRMQRKKTVEKAKTVKFLTAVTRNGFVRYINCSCENKAAPDKLTDLEKGGEVVFGDKGLLSNELCESNGIKIIRPPRHKRDKNSDENARNAKFMSVKVCTERVHQSVRSFRLLSDKMERNLLPVVNDLFLVVCGIVNCNHYEKIKELDL